MLKVALSGGDSVAKALCHCVDQRTGEHVTLEYEVTRVEFDGRVSYIYKLKPTPPGVSIVRLRVVSSEFFPD